MHALIGRPDGDDETHEPEMADSMRALTTSEGMGFNVECNTLKGTLPPTSLCFRLIAYLTESALQ